MLLVYEIYNTILGESREAGRPCIIVRLTGCHRRCRYCDTEYAFTGGEERSVTDICRSVTKGGARTVLVTGGEPLLQDEVLPLLRELLAANYRVLLETSGTKAPVSLTAVPAGVHRIVDVKTPGSGIAEDQIDWAGIRSLGHNDEVKFVCCDRSDYEWARDVVRDVDRLPMETDIVFSPSHGQLPLGDLAGWILADGLEVRLQFQLHKAIWPDRDRGT